MKGLVLQDRLLVFRAQGKVTQYNTVGKINETVAFFFYLIVIQRYIMHIMVEQWKWWHDDVEKDKNKTITEELTIHLEGNMDDCTRLYGN